MSGKGIGSELADHMEAIPLADMTLEDQAVFRRAVEWLRHADELEAIAVNAMNVAAGGTYAGPSGVSFADRIHDLEKALKPFAEAMNAVETKKKLLKTWPSPWSQQDEAQLRAFPLADDFLRAREAFTNTERTKVDSSPRNSIEQNLIEKNDD